MSVVNNHSRMAMPFRPIPIPIPFPLPQQPAQDIKEYTCHSDKSTSIAQFVQGNGDIRVKSKQNLSTYQVHSNLFFSYLPPRLAETDRKNTEYTYNYDITFICIVIDVYLGDTSKRNIPWRKIPTLITDIEKYIKDVPTSPLIPKLKESLSFVYDGTLEDAKTLFQYGYFTTKYYDKFTSEELSLLLKRKFIMDVDKLFTMLNNKENNRDLIYIILMLYYNNVDIPLTNEQTQILMNNIPTFGIITCEQLMRYFSRIPSRAMIFCFPLYRLSLYHSSKEKQIEAYKTPTKIIDNSICSIFTSLLSTNTKRKETNPQPGDEALEVDVQHKNKKQASNVEKE